MEKKDKVRETLEIFFDNNVEDLVIAEQHAKNLLECLTRLKDRMMLLRNHVGV